ncbi:alginate O-acetyltransferase AlgX-related protein [Saccharothrix longispora]|uniref:alginate O-acetyltransferase AlgX-related protein n=1 Tax=Saccharothrix longispora TaxID=33920 RepID=UPI0028FD28CA|nr:hypothetical protein [Saccharothrix longispora]MDU0293453.1 hypothetical protein [Saccharothrix longispora]
MSVDLPRKLPSLPESLLPREHNLYRPRHSSRQRTALVAATLFFCLPALLLVVGVRPARFENRDLAEFPSVTDGWSFFTGLNAWADDHIPFRDKAVAAADGISRGVFQEPPPVVVRRPQEPGGPIPLPSGDPSLDQPDPTAYVRALEGKDGWLYLGADVQQACEPKIELGEVFTRLNRLRTAVEASGRRFVLVVAPNKSTMVPEKMPAKYFGKACHQQATEAFWASLTARTGALDLRPALREAATRAGRPIYTQYDSHWDHDGSVVLARRIVDAVQPGTSASWKVEPTKVVERFGDLATLAGRTETERFQAYDVKPDGVNVRSHILTGDEAEPQRSTQPPTKGVVDTKVGLLGDSFTYAGTQFLVAGFTDITVQHMRALVDDPFRVGRMFAANDVVVVQVAERNLTGGINAVLNTKVLEAIESELVKAPR